MSVKFSGTDTSKTEIVNLDYNDKELRWFEKKSISLLGGGSELKALDYRPALNAVTGCWVSRALNYNSEGLVNRIHKSNHMMTVLYTNDNGISESRLVDYNDPGYIWLQEKIIVESETKREKAATKIQALSRGRYASVFKIYN